MGILWAGIWSSEGNLGTSLEVDLRVNLRVDSGSILGQLWTLSGPLLGNLIRTP